MRELMNSTKLERTDRKGEYRYEDAQCSCSTHYLLPIIKELTATMSPGSVVVDAGCGNGSLLAQMQRRDWQMHGLEVSVSGLAQAKAAFPGIHFHRVDLT